MVWCREKITLGQHAGLRKRRAERREDRCEAVALIMAKGKDEWQTLSTP